LGIVHRDLKPQNIMIDPDGNAKIMDFGIARSTQADGVTQEGTVIGTPEYMSPEQVEGRAVDQRSDIYALGIILFEMLTGKVPFTGKSALDVALKHKTEEPENPQRINPKVPETLSALILRAMAKATDDRFQNSIELLKALLAIEENLPETERSARRIVPRIGGRRATQSGIRKAVIATASAAALIVIALFTWRLLFPPAAAEAAGMPTVAILDFENRTGDPSLDIWQRNLADFVSTPLTDSKYIHVVPAIRIRSQLKTMDIQDARELTEEQLKILSKALDASHIINGFFTRESGTFRVDTRLIDPRTMDLVGALEASGHGKTPPLHIANDLAEKLKPLLGLDPEEIANDIQVDVAATSTPSVQAHDFYLKARDAFALYELQDVVDNCQNAVAIDPDFAIAYCLMAIAQADQTLNQEAAASMQKAAQAMEHRPVSDRDRGLIEGWYAFIVERDYESSFGHFKDLYETYPDDFMVNKHMGMFYFWRYQDFAKAQVHYETLVQSGLAWIGDYMKLRTIYCGQRRYDKSLEILKQAKTKYPDKWQPVAMTAVTYYLDGRYEKALAECDNVYLVNPRGLTHHSLRGNTYFYMEDFPAAEQEYRTYLVSDNVDVRAVGRNALIALYNLQGRFRDVDEQVALLAEDPGVDLNKRWTWIYLERENWEAAAQACEQWDPIDPLERLFWKPHAQALLKAKFQKWEEADTIVREMIDNLATYEYMVIHIPQKILWDIQGRIALERGDFSRAIDFFTRIKDNNQNFQYQGLAWHSEALARSYLGAGEIRKARREYEWITTLRGGRYIDGIIYAKAFYMLGKIAEDLGDKREARKQYNRFLDLWKNADPGLAEVEDAKARLEAL